MVQAGWADGPGGMAIGSGGPRPVGVEPRSVAEISTLPTALDKELDEVLSLLPLVDTEPGVGDKVFGELVDCLVEAVLHDVRVRHEQWDLTRPGYLTEICGVVTQLQERGLLGGYLPPSR
jgi:hypothetical protein